ncbi:MAG: pitrilysin family protein [Pseudomonadota bacterium]|nr:pitrilysin family protein [Pseudomonadota bacterium]
MPAQAMRIQKVTSPGGIEAWLVESHEVPLIAMQFGFAGGSLQDPDGRDGLANFVSGILDEGAGDLDAIAFHERMQELAVRMSFDAGRDVFSGSLQTLTENSAEGFELLRMALTEARFDEDAIARIRTQIVAGLKIEETDPDRVAGREWYKLAFGEHPYSRPPQGDIGTVQAITAVDLKDYARRVFARDSLKVAVVGDIDAKRLASVLDQVFGSLPAKGDLRPVDEAKPPMGPIRKVVEMDVPQSVARFGHLGLKRSDKDFVAASVLNYIVGGGGFSSRLMEEVREKRGLAYSVYSYLSPYRHAALYLGGVATENKSIGQSLEVIQNVLRDLATNGPSQQELDAAKSYMTGSFPLRFDTSGKIASQLLWIQIENLGIDYIDKRNSLVEAVTLEDIKRVAKRLIHADGLIVIVVGKPAGTL